MTFRDFADLFAQIGWGRSISKEEALQIAATSEEEGLVLQTKNEQEARFVCSCCGDCCGLLNLAKARPRPAEFFASNYYARGDPNLCTRCGTCADSRQMSDGGDRTPEQHCRCQSRPVCRLRGVCTDMPLRKQAFGKKGRGGGATQGHGGSLRIHYGPQESHRAESADMKNSNCLCLPTYR
jgi:hypothetical protein